MRASPSRVNIPLPEREEGRQETRRCTRISDKEMRLTFRDAAPQAGNSDTSIFGIGKDIKTQVLKRAYKIAGIIREKRVGEFGGAIRQGGNEQGTICQRF